MNTISKGILFLSLMILLIDMSCKKESSTSTKHMGEPFQIKTGEAVSVSPVLSDINIPDSNLTVNFKEVINDSRCAKASCYLCYGSSATIRVLLSDSKINLDIPLTILGCQDEYECDNNLYYRVDTLGYRICLLRLDPYPGDSDAINTLNYTAKLNISRY